MQCEIAQPNTGERCVIMSTHTMHVKEGYTWYMCSWHLVHTILAWDHAIVERIATDNEQELGANVNPGPYMGTKVK